MIEIVIEMFIILEVCYCLVLQLEVYMLTAGIVLCVLGILMLLGMLGFLIDRYEWFHKSIRKRTINVRREILAKFYAALFVVTGVPLLIGAIIGYINKEAFETYSLWLFIAVAALGVIGILFCNLTNLFIQASEETVEASIQE